MARYAETLPKRFFFTCTGYKVLSDFSIMNTRSLMEQIPYPSTLSTSALIMRISSNTAMRVFYKIATFPEPQYLKAEGPQSL